MEQHRCPECGSGDIYTTCLGYVGKDHNEVTCCKCSNKGIAHEWEAKGETEQ